MIWHVIARKKYGVEYDFFTDKVISYAVMAAELESPGILCEKLL
jgi:hypothetical protein